MRSVKNTPNLPKKERTKMHKEIDNVDKQPGGITFENK